METRKIKTRFMIGNLDVNNVIMDLMVDTYGWSALGQTKWMNDNIIYSDRFIDAINEGKTPELDLIETMGQSKSEQEYHHCIIEDVCYHVYFN